MTNLIVLAAALNGTMVFTEAEVVPGPGDPDGTGRGRFHLYPMKNKICYRVTVSGIQAATKAHLHMGDPGEQGNTVKLNLLPPRNSARGCIRGLGERFIKKIAHNSSSYYLDVHNNEYPGGALGGQLTR